MKIERCIKQANFQAGMARLMVVFLLMSCCVFIAPALSQVDPDDFFPAPVTQTPQDDSRAVPPGTEGMPSQATQDAARPDLTRDGQPQEESNQGEQPGTSAVNTAGLDLRTIMRNQMALRDEDIVRGTDVPSLMFTLWQHSLIGDAKRLFTTSRPSPGEVERDPPRLENPNQIDPGLREISLGGIAFNSEKNWTVWLNGQRVKPDALPEEVIDINVYNEYVELKWYDEFTNVVFPIRIRPHQRFNLDARIFLPGLPK